MTVACTVAPVCAPHSLPATCAGVMSVGLQATLMVTPENFSGCSIGAASSIASSVRLVRNKSGAPASTAPALRTLRRETARESLRSGPSSTM